MLTRTPGCIKKDVNVKEYVKLSFSNEKVANDNYESLKSLNVPIAQVNARHNTPAAAKLTSDDMGGLEPKLFLAKGARVMLTRNLWTEKGLCNGSMGTVVDIVYKEGDHPPALPIAVIVQFDDTYTGPSFRSDIPRSVPIIPQTNESDLYGSSHERQQLPLKLSWAITIHKSQGLTLDKAWVDIGKSEKFTGLTYVALSRVRRLEDLIIEPMTLERLQSIKQKNSFKYRVLEKKRLDGLAMITVNPYFH